MCNTQGIYPSLSLFNNLMDWYANELRLGDVVRLLTDMTQHARLQVCWVCTTIVIFGLLIVKRMDCGCDGCKIIEGGIIIFQAARPCCLF